MSGNGGSEAFGGQRDVDDGADAEFAGEAQRAVMKADYGAGERQPQSNALIPFCQVVFDLAERLEHAVELVVGDTASGVADRHDETVPGSCGRGKDDAAAFAVEFDRV